MITCAIGATEIILICVVILLIFGGKKIPELMKGVGQGVRQFKKGLNEDEPAETLSTEARYRQREEMKTKIIREKEEEENKLTGNDLTN